MRSHHRSWQVLLRWVAAGVCVLLVSCADQPTATESLPTAETAGTAAPTEPIAALITATPSPTPPPTETPSPVPTLTPTPASSPEGDLRPTFTATAIPSPTQTLQELAPATSPQLEAARRHQTNGEYGAAILAYQALLDGQATPEDTHQALYHLAETYALNRDYTTAAATWEQFVAGYPADRALPQAHLMAGRAYDAAGACEQAIPHYQAYLGDEIVLADMVYEWIGDCYAGAAQVQEAIGAYRQAVEATTDRGVEVSLREKTAGVHLSQEDYAAAVAEYDTILDMARIDFYRAKIEYLAGQALAAGAQPELAHERYRRAVEGYPRTQYAYLSLIELVDAGVQVDEFQRGLVDYYAGASSPDAYGAAVAAFDRYLAAAPTDKVDEALYRKALSQKEIGQASAALDTLETLITDHPQSRWLVSAWFEKGNTMAGAGDSAGAIQVYQELASHFPNDRLAPEALWEAARLREREGSNLQAAELFRNLQAAFPAFKDSDEALWRAGLALYLAGSREEAAATWQLLADQYPSSAYRPKAFYWLGKLAAETGAGQGNEYWDKLVRSQQRQYYGLRVQQIRSGDSLTATRLISAPVDPPPWDGLEAEAEVLDWLQGWTDVATGTSLIDLPASLTKRRNFRRGQALLDVGLRREALAELDGLRTALQDDPLALAQVTFFLRERGLHGSAARGAIRLADLWPEGGIHATPITVQRLAYPLAYADLLSAQAQARNLDPLLLAALVRQESLFEPVAESYAGARGLGQVMPATGKGIAKSLGLDDFVLDDLYRPSISVEFGAFYLDVQLGRFDDQILIALAAYNGGPGNTLYWLEAGGDDLDLFVEVIGAAQSRIYLQRVYAQYLKYESLYRENETEQ